MHFIEYTKHPVKSVISIKQSSSVIFPAVTLCNLNPIRKSYLQEVTPNQAAFLSLNKEGFGNLYEVKKNEDDDELDTEDSEWDEHQLVGVNATRFAEEGSHRLEEMLLSCTWKNAKCTNESFTKRWTNFGYCFTFNEPAQGDVHMAGRHERFSVVLDVQQNEYSLRGLESAVGFAVILHEQEDVPLIYDFGFLTPPGYRTQVAIKRKVVRCIDLYSLQPV
ncbi:putative acid-sensing ion channel 3-like [Apostichopus japonicus]|uniref:Putative acid-sensing ion channel 3-like n=1 Tax=Stichopus japonicus TaxID=307972 RepID=A0A2G8KWC0_STIJA|nr:putative acid-sensing ion channel 3-like [Apostichopus japonicus]